MSWRPEGWEKIKLEATIALLKRIKPKRKPPGEQWFEAGADAMLEAQKKEGRYFAKGSTLVSEGNPDVHFDFDRGGWLVFILEEEEA